MRDAIGRCKDFVLVLANFGPKGVPNYGTLLFLRVIIPSFCIVGIGLGFELHRAEFTLDNNHRCVPELVNFFKIKSAL